MAELEQIGNRIANLIFTLPGWRLFKKRLRLDGMQAFRPGREGGIVSCEPDQAGAFQADGRGLHLAVLCTGFPEGCLKLFAQMEVRCINGASKIDATGHDHLNFIMLNRWLPKAHYTVFILPHFHRADKGLGVYDHHIDSALEECKNVKDLDFIISSVAPSDPTFFNNMALIAHPGYAAELYSQTNREERNAERVAEQTPSKEAPVVVSFWPTGNWVTGTSKSWIGSVDQHIILSGQVREISILGWRSGLFRIPPDARYDEEHNLPLFWAPGPGGTQAGTTGSSYSPVPVALVWIKCVQILLSLERHKIIDPLRSNLTAFLRTHLHRGRAFKYRVLTVFNPGFPKLTKGLINLPLALEQVLLGQLGKRGADRVVGGLSARIPRPRIPLIAMGLGGAMMGAGFGYFFHIDLWVHYSFFLDLFHSAGWTYTVAIFKPGWVIAQRYWSMGGWGLAGLLLLVCLGRGIRGGMEP